MTIARTVVSAGARLLSAAITRPATRAPGTVLQTGDVLYVYSTYSEGPR
jgi:hypothetical protein